ncbi:MAG: hypothetical protein COA96_11445, partial [SAR86 cluster bacterium]
SLAEVNSVSIRSQVDPNAILITEIDIVFVYTKEIGDSFPSSKSAWYSGKQSLIQKAGDDVEIVNVFIPQGFDSENARLPTRKHEAVKVFIIAYHDDPEVAPIDVTEMVDVFIEIDAFGIFISSKQ